MRPELLALFRRLTAGNFHGGSRSNDAAYKPKLSEGEFFHFLSSKGDLGTVINQRNRLAETAELSYDVAISFRNRIAVRFFVHPDEVASAVERLRKLNPDWQRCLEESSDEWLNVGLPIYAHRGPKLDEHFLWSANPLGPDGDALYSFRPHRFAFLPRLAMAAYLGFIGPERLQGILVGWVSAAERGDNPFCYGTNLVVIQRFLATIWAWLFLAARAPERTQTGLGLETLLLRILWADAQFLEPRLGESVPNNHLLADRFASFFLHTVLPEFMLSADDRSDENFKDELFRQTYEDGGGFEHSIHYHEFACEMAVAFLLLREKQGMVTEDTFRARLERLLMFQLRLTGPYSIPAPIGNATEDTLFPLDVDGTWCAGSLRELYRALFDRDFASAPEHDNSRERAFWMLGGRLEPTGGNNKLDLLPSSMADAGFHVFPDLAMGGRLLFRSGPAEGVRVVAGHMHADFLSVDFTKGGLPILVDAGTFTYRNSCKPKSRNLPAWRSYLAGPSAHNTLTIPGADPLGSITGDFREFDTSLRVQSRTRLGDGLSWTEACMVDAGLYTGYLRGCVHVQGRYWVIYDKVPKLNEDVRRLWFGFQFDPEIEIAMDGGIATAKHRSLGDAIVLLSSLSEAPQLLEGSMRPLGGWVSRRYGEISPAPQLRYFAESTLHPSAFVIADAAGNSPESVKVQPLGDGLVGICVGKQSGEDWLVLAHSCTACCGSEIDDLFFDGSLLWLSFGQARLKQMRWIHGKHVKWPSRDIDLELGMSIGAWVAPEIQERDSRI